MIKPYEDKPGPIVEDPSQATSFLRNKKMRIWIRRVLAVVAVIGVVALMIYYL